MLQLEQVKKTFGQNPVLDIPSLGIAPGIYWIKGANGSGKTTLLKIIAGLLPFEGDVILESVSQKKSPVAYRKKIGWAEAEPLFPEFISGSNLVALFSSIRKISQNEITALLEFFKVTEFVDNAIGSYSAGMVKKLSLVLALLGDPPLVILDEPLITLDEESFGLVSGFILEKKRTNNISFLMSSHQEPDKQFTAHATIIHVENKTATIE